jgi:segregation and condensation protein A
MENMLGRQVSKYKVQTAIYEGPLDLLLSLIERAELDITTVSLSMVTDQYLNYIHNLAEAASAEEISAFLVIAAKLVQIKSEALLPRPPEREPGEEDVGTSLVEQLRLYKRFKEIAVWLAERQEMKWRTYLRVAPPPKIEAKLDLSNVTLKDLVEAAVSVFHREEEKKSLGTVIGMPKITIREKIELITRTLNEVQRASFRGLIGDKATRVEIVVTFLALLELVKRYHVEAHQEGLFGEIQIERRGEWEQGGDLDIEDIEFE